MPLGRWRWWPLDGPINPDYTIIKCSIWLWWLRRLRRLLWFVCHNLSFLLTALFRWWWWGPIDWTFLSYDTTSIDVSIITFFDRNFTRCGRLRLVFFCHELPLSLHPWVVHGFLAFARRLSVLLITHWQPGFINFQRIIFNLLKLVPSILIF
jgi:hypothetical protein